MAPKVDKEGELNIQIANLGPTGYILQVAIDQAYDNMKHWESKRSESKSGIWNTGVNFLEKNISQGGQTGDDKRWKAAKKDWEDAKKALAAHNVKVDKLVKERDEYVETTSSTDAKKALTSMYKEGMSKWSKDKFTEGKIYFGIVP